MAFWLLVAARRAASRLRRAQANPRLRRRSVSHHARPLLQIAARNAVRRTVVDVRARRSFTLLETVVVVVLVGVLAVVGYVTLTNFGSKVHAVPVETHLQQAAAAEQSAYVQVGSFVSYNDLGSYMQSYSFVGPTTPAGVASISVDPSAVSGVAVVGLSALGPDGTCYELLTYPPTASTAQQTGSIAPGTGSSCTGAMALSPTGAPW